MLDGTIEHAGQLRASSSGAASESEPLEGAMERRDLIPLFQSVGPKEHRRFAWLGPYLVTESRWEPVAGSVKGRFIFSLEYGAELLRSPAVSEGDAINSDVEPLKGVSSFGPTTVTQIPLEDQHKEKMIVRSSGDAREAQRTEAKLVIALGKYVEAHSMSAVRHQICPAGEQAAMLTDIFIREQNLLIEAKGSADRASFRMALGQLADYRRFLDNPTCAILLPHEPKMDLLELAGCEGVSVIWPVGDAYAGTIAVGD